jgi:hypothetical protein
MQEEIAGAENVAVQTVNNVISDFSNINNLAKSGKVAAEHATDFESPPYARASPATPWDCRPAIAWGRWP